MIRNNKESDFIAEPAAIGNYRELVSAKTGWNGFEDDDFELGRLIKHMRQLNNSFYSALSDDLWANTSHIEPEIVRRFQADNQTVDEARASWKTLKEEIDFLKGDKQ